MTRDELTEMIRSEIRSLAFDTLRNKSSNEKSEKNKIFKPKGLSEEELEHALFYGGNKPEEKDIKKLTTKINESVDSGVPKINSSDITEFEDSFEQMLSEIDGASIVFDKQSNGYSMKMGISSEGIECFASGKIELGIKGKVVWSFSLKNGLTISTDKLVLDKGNKLIVEKIYNNYDAWQKDWREKLTIQPNSQDVNTEVSPEESNTSINTPTA